MKVPYLNLKSINEAYEPTLSERMTDVVKSGRYLNGPELKRFEDTFAEYVGCRYCVGVANGLDALTLGLKAMRTLRGWTDGDEVIVPAMTFVATAEAVCRAGLFPVACDVNMSDYTIDAEKIEPLINKRTRALLPVHLYGHPCNMDRLLDIARKHGLVLFEDAAQAHGAKWHDRRCGHIGHAAAFSFYPGKNLGALGDAGAFCTDDAELAALVRTLANYGASNKYNHTHHGLNSRMDEIQAAALSVKLRGLDADNLRRQTIAKRYMQEIHNDFVRLPYSSRSDVSVFHIFPLLSPKRDALREHLNEHGVETIIHYPLAIHQQPAFASVMGGCFPCAERIAAEELSLPISPLLTDNEITYIINTINNFSL